MFKPGIIVETYHAHRVHEKGYLESLRSYPSDSLVLRVGTNSFGETTIFGYDLNYDYFYSCLGTSVRPVEPAPPSLSCSKLMEIGRKWLSHRQRAQGRRSHLAYVPQCFNQDFFTISGEE